MSNSRYMPPFVVFDISATSLIPSCRACNGVHESLGRMSNGCQSDEKSEFENTNVHGATVGLDHVPDCIWPERIPHLSDSSPIPTDSSFNVEYKTLCGLFV